MQFHVYCATAKKVDCCVGQKCVMWVGKENTYDEGEEITPQQLMQVALQKYKTQIDNGTWQSLTAEEDRIMALEAEFVQLQRRTNTNSNNNRCGNNRNNNNTNNSNNNNSNN